MSPGAVSRGVTLARVAKDFGTHEVTLSNWMRQADIEEGNRPGVTAAESTELRDARRRIRLLEQENEVLFGKRRGKNGKRPGPPVHDDLVQRDFTADRLDELWLTDITEQRTDEGKLYLCAVKDICSGRIVGYSIEHSRWPGPPGGTSSANLLPDVVTSLVAWCIPTADPNSVHANSFTL